MTNEQLGYQLNKLTALVLELSKNIEALRPKVTEARSQTYTINSLRGRIARLEAELKVRRSVESALGGLAEPHEHQLAVNKKYRYERTN